MQRASLLEVPIREAEPSRPLSPEMREAIASRIQTAVRSGRLPCAAGMAIARGLGVAAGEVGRVANELGIKIAGCQLGCF